MYLLAIDTATNSGGVAMSRNAEVIGVAMLKTPLRYAEHLIEYIDFLFEQLELSIDDIDCCVATCGPGSFTGLRIGLATVKGLCQNRDLSCAAVPTMEALAWRFADVETHVCALLDARRQQVYAAAYDVSGPSPRLVFGPKVGPANELADQLPRQPWLLVGDGAQLYAGSLEATRPDCRLLRTDNFLLNALCNLGYQRLVNGSVVSAHELRALYVRPPDIRLPG